MTEENKRANIAQELERAAQCLTVARLAADHGAYASAVAQAYYFAFHYARALLLCEGLEAKTHSGIAHLINVHFVRTGELDPKLSRALGDLHGMRLAADYDAASVFTEDISREEIERAVRYGETAREIMRRKGYV